MILRNSYLTKSILILCSYIVISINISTTYGSSRSASYSDFLTNCLFTSNLETLSVSFCGQEVPDTAERDKIATGLKLEIRDAFTNPLFSEFSGKKVEVLITDQLKNYEAYTSPEFFERRGHPVIVLSLNSAFESSSRKRLIAHELMHNLLYIYRPSEDRWIEEGLAMLFEYELTGQLNPVFLSGFSQPETSLLIDERDREFATVPQYGHILQYFYYLYENCGGSELLNTLVFKNKNLHGFALIDRSIKEYLALSPVCKNYKSSYRAFQIARYNPKASPKSARIKPGNFKASPSDYNEHFIPPPAPGAKAISIEAGENCPPHYERLSSTLCLLIKFE